MVELFILNVALINHWLPPAEPQLELGSITFSSQNKTQ